MKFNVPAGLGNVFTFGKSSRTAHPHYWKVVNVDETTGTVTAMLDDEHCECGTLHDALSYFKCRFDGLGSRWIQQYGSLKPTDFFYRFTEEELSGIVFRKARYLPMDMIDPDDPTNPIPVIRGDEVVGAWLPSLTELGVDLSAETFDRYIERKFEGEVFQYFSKTYQATKGWWYPKHPRARWPKYLTRTVFEIETVDLLPEDISEMLDDDHPGLYSGVTGEHYGGVMLVNTFSPEYELRPCIDLRLDDFGG